MNIISPVQDLKDRMYFVDCQSDENNPFLEFYLNDQSNGLDCSAKCKWHENPHHKS